jgi:hypothetical protein
VTQHEVVFRAYKRVHLEQQNSVTAYQIAIILKIRPIAVLSQNVFCYGRHKVVKIRKFVSDHYYLDQKALN